MTRQDSALQTPGRPDPRQVAHQQSQVESAHVDWNGARILSWSATRARDRLVLIRKDVSYWEIRS